jgi:hypothetical protein
VWLLETSTNPDVISAAADIAADLSWPLYADIDVALDRLWETFWACFIPVGPDYSFQVQHSSIQHAITCGQAYGTMSISSRRNTSKLINPYEDLVLTMAGGTESSQLAQLHSVFNALRGDPECFRSIRTQPMMQWVLHVLPQTIRIVRFRFAEFAHLKGMLDYVSTSQTGFVNQIYADCLLLLNIILGFKAHPDILVWKDKRLTHHLFELSIL